MRNIRSRIIKVSGTYFLSFFMTSRIPSCTFCYASNKSELSRFKREMALMIEIFDRNDYSLTYISLINVKYILSTVYRKEKMEL